MKFRKQITDYTCLVSKKYGDIEEHLYVSPVALIYDVLVRESRNCRRSMIHVNVPLECSTARSLIDRVSQLSPEDAFRYLRRILDENQKRGNVRSQSYHIFPL